eukprot:1177403-Prorocentrum_minimum.AAC.1
MLSSPLRLALTSRRRSLPPCDWLPHRDYALFSPVIGSPAARGPAGGGRAPLKAEANASARAPAPSGGPPSLGEAPASASAGSPPPPGPPGGRPARAQSASAAPPGPPACHTSSAGPSPAASGTGEPHDILSESRDWFPRKVYSLSPHVTGPPGRYITSPIFSKFSNFGAISRQEHALFPPAIGPCDRRPRPTNTLSSHTSIGSLQLLVPHRAGPAPAAGTPSAGPAGAGGGPGARPSPSAPGEAPPPREGGRP